MPLCAETVADGAGDNIQQDINYTAVNWLYQKDMT